MVGRCATSLVIVATAHPKKIKKPGIIPAWPKSACASVLIVELRNSNLTRRTLIPYQPASNNHPQRIWPLLFTVIELMGLSVALTLVTCDEVA